MNEITPVDRRDWVESLQQPAVLIFPTGETFIMELNRAQADAILLGYGRVVEIVAIAYPRGECERDDD